MTLIELYKYEMEEDFPEDIILKIMSITNALSHPETHEGKYRMMKSAIKKVEQTIHDNLLRLTRRGYVLQNLNLIDPDHDDLIIATDSVFKSIKEQEHLFF